MAFRKRTKPPVTEPRPRPAERQQEDPEAYLLTEEEIRNSICFACSKHPNECTCVTPDAWHVLPYNPEFWRLCGQCKKPFAVPRKTSSFTHCIVCMPGEIDRPKEKARHAPVPKTPELFATA